MEKKAELRKVKDKNETKTMKTKENNKNDEQ